MAGNYLHLYIQGDFVSTVKGDDELIILFGDLFNPDE